MGKEHLCTECGPQSQRDCVVSINLTGKPTCDLIEMCERFADEEVKRFLEERFGQITGADPVAMSGEKR